MALVENRRRHKSASLGGIDPERADTVTKGSIERLKERLAPMKGQDRNLDSIDAVVGRPEERLLPRDLLIPAPKQWECFPRATDEKIREMSESIRVYGLLHNITVWEQPSGKYMILGGHTREKCFDYLYENGEPKHNEKYKSIPALVYKAEQLTENDAHRIYIISNTDQRELSVRSRSEAYMELIRLEKEHSFYGSYISTRKAAATQANVSESMLNNYLGLLDLIPDLMNEVDAGDLAVMTGYHISRLPKKFQQYLYDSGAYIRLSTQGARQLKKAGNIDELKRIIDDLTHARKYYKYQITVKKQKPESSEILPLFVEKDRVEEYIDRYIQAVDESDFAPELKEMLKKAMMEAKGVTTMKRGSNGDVTKD